jgi:hypothetical protein
MPGCAKNLGTSPSGTLLAVSCGMLKALARPDPERMVLVVSGNPETLDGLHDYFSQTGIASSSRRTLNPLAEVAAPIRALVVFPDDFPSHEVAAYLSLLRTRRPDLTLVVISKEPALYAEMKALDGHPLGAIVLPRPAFGWTIVDALRPHNEDALSKQE